MAYPLHISPQIASTLAMIAAALAIIFIRLRAARKPVTARKILIPPLGMSTGFAMFLFPFMRISWMWALGAFAAGAILLSYPLIRTSRFIVSGGDIYLERSRAFVFILLAILAVRLALHSYVEEFITLPQTGAVFFILAFGMLLPWRLSMYSRFTRLLQEMGQKR